MINTEYQYIQYPAHRWTKSRKLYH